MASTKLERVVQSLSHVATILAAVVAVIAVYYGYQQFRATQEATRETLALQKKGYEQEQESKAVDLTVKYNEVMSDPRSSQKSANGEDNFSWRDNLGLTIAESIFTLRGDDEGWRETVRWMLHNHTDFLKKKINCPTYDPSFIKFVNEYMRQDVCEAPRP